MKLDNKIALVTGASRGIGKAIAKILCENGAFVYLAARDAEKLSVTAKEIDPSGTKTKVIPTNITSNTSVGELFSKIKAEEKSLDIVVNAAGIAPAVAAEDLTYQDWKNVLNTNLNSVFSICQSAFEGMKAKGGGKIINIASILGSMASPGLTAYCTSKAGVIMLSKQLAVEWAHYNVNVNAIAPGYISTDMTKSLRNDNTLNQKLLARAPLCRWGKPEDVAKVALFLASDDSDYVTGAVIPVDGGMSASLM